MKKTYVCYISILLLTSVFNSRINSYMRDPFSYGEKYKCIAIGQFDKESYFAIVFYQGKNYIIKKGDIFLSFTVTNITDFSIELIKSNGDKKTLQLRKLKG